MRSPFSLEAYEAKGDYATAAELNRDFLSAEPSISAPLTLVPYSAISHGAEHYSELRVVGTAGGGVLFDSEVIELRGPTIFVRSNLSLLSAPEGLSKWLSETQYHSLLRDDFLSGNSDALREDLRRAPEEVRNSELALLLVGVDRFLNQRASASALTQETQAAIDDFLAPYDELPSGWVRGPGEPPLLGNDLFYYEAGNFLRQYGQFVNAIEVYKFWRAQLKHADAEDERLAEVENLLGEAYFLAGKHDDALAAFDRAVDKRPDWAPYVVRQAFMHQKLEEYAEARDLYRLGLDLMQKRAGWMNTSVLEQEGVSPASYYFPDSYQASKHLGDVLLRQAISTEQTGSENIENAQDEYTEAARAYRKALVLVLDPLKFHSVVSTAAANNLGIVLLKIKDYEEAIEVLESLTRPTGTPPPSWYPLSPDNFQGVTPDITGHNHALVPDEHSPVFHLNLGWAYDLVDQPEKAREQYLTAVRSDPSLYPALNDLGVMAAEEGNLGEAKKYFHAALDAESDYAYASHNLGVALLRSGGISNFLAAQGFLARAADQDSSLAEIRYDYIFDNELYILNLSLADKIPEDWEFAAHAERSTLALSVGVVALLLWGIIRRTAYEKGRETLVGKVIDFLQEGYGGPVSRPWAQVREGWLRLSRLGRPTRARWWITPLALVVTALVVALLQGWSLVWEESAVKVVMVATLLYVALVSMLVHHAGHAVVALRSHLQVREAPWPAGIAQAIVLVAASGAFVAPMPSTSVEGEADKRRQESVLLAGPLASILFAVLLHVLYVTTHIPLFDFGAVLNLGLAAASLLSLPPLEGATISEGYYTRWPFWMATFVTVMSAILAASSFF